MMSGPTRKLKADGLPSDITQVRLKTFFSNENSQGGGPVEDVQISEDRTSAIITFKEVEAVERIIKRKDTVSMSSVFVKVSPCFDEIPNDRNGNLADEMKAIKSKSMELEMSDEANKKTTMTNTDTKGPDLSAKDLSLENCHKPQSSSTNLNTDLSSEDCQDHHTMSLHRHVVADDTRINKGTEMTSKDELPVYSNLIYLQGDLGNLEKLAKQITALTGLHVDDIIQQDLPDRCIVAFMADFNLEEILMEDNGLTLGSKQLIAKPVFNTNSILVNGLSEKVTVSSLKAYLKNKVPSWGGQMKSLEEINQDKQAVVYFERSIDADDILFLKQEFEIDGETLFLSKYFPCLSEVKYEAEDGFTPEIPIAISVQKNLLSQIETKNKSKQIYHGRLRKVISLYSDCEAISSREQLNVSGVTIKNFGIHEFLQRADGQELIGRIQEKHGCIIKVVPNPKMNLSLGGPGDSLKMTTTENSWKIRHLKINLIIGEIEKQTSDIIVITVNTTLNLKVGVLAQIILSQAGDEVQRTLEKRYPKGIKLGEFAETSGGKLQTKHIFHACVPKYSQEAVQQMSDLLENLLARAEILQAKSISFPALGTGGLSFPLDIFSKVMLESIIQHSKLKSDSLQQIQLVVFPSDTEAAETIQSVFSTGFKEANAKLKGNVYRYGHIFLRIKVGDITEQETDVIVTGIKDSMNLASSGEVCNVLLEKCGKKLQDECNTKKTDLDLNDVTMTSAPNLSCQHIIFMNKDAFAPRLAQGIFKVLIEAEKLGATSLALPALGAGFHKKNITSIKQCIFQAVEAFGLLPTQNLRKIKVVILNAAILDDFLHHEGSHPHLYNKETTDTTMLPENISQEVDVHFYSIHALDRIKAAKELLEACKLAYKKEIEYNVHLLSSIQIEELLKLCLEHLIIAKIDIKCGFLEMEGFHSNGMLKVKTRLKTMIEGASKRRTNIGIEWHYTQEENCEIEKTYQHEASSCKGLDTIGFIHDINFPGMTANGNTGTLSRERVNKSFYLHIHAQELWPKRWEPMLKTQNLKVVEVIPQSEEYSEVEKHFHLTLPDFPLKKLERIQNKSLYLQYCVKKKELDQYNPQDHQNEQKLFHGTMSDCIPPINENGFNRNYCGVNGTVYGSGVYFADKSSYSCKFTKPDLDGNRHMYRARVLTGEFIETNSSTKYLPKKPGTNRPYDSGGDKSRGIYVIFHDSQVYPEYLITF